MTTTPFSGDTASRFLSKEMWEWLFNTSSSRLAKWHYAIASPLTLISLPTPSKHTSRDSSSTQQKSQQGSSLLKATSWMISKHPTAAGTSKESGPTRTLSEKINLKKGRRKNGNKNAKKISVCLYPPHKDHGYKHVLKDFCDCPSDEKPKILRNGENRTHKTGRQRTHQTNWSVQ